MQTVYAIQHIAFEDLGTWEDVLYQHNYRVRYVEAGVDDLSQAMNHEGLTIILGGPIGVYETHDYPFLENEISLLKQRLEKKLPTIGICLGAQLIAHALGAAVYAGAHKEIGWSTLQLSQVDHQPLAALQNLNVLHWHGDTFDLPPDAEHLASSAVYQNQAYRIGTAILGLQFHPEVAANQLEKWLIGHTAELRQAGINIGQLRSHNERYAPLLEDASARMLKEYLKQNDQI